MAKCPKCNSPIPLRKALNYRNGIMCDSCGAKSFIKKDKTTMIYTYFPYLIPFMTLLIVIPLVFISIFIFHDFYLYAFVKATIKFLLILFLYLLVCWTILWKRITLEMRDKN